MRLRTKYTHRLPTAPGLVLDVPMFEGSGTKVLDLSGKGNHGTITDALWTRDENGVAMSFNGTSAYIDCGNDASLNITDVITVEVWVKPEKSGYAKIVSKYDSGGTDGFFLRLDADNKLHFKLYSTDGGDDAVTSPSAVPLSEWIHVVGVGSSSRVKVYLNGIEVGDIARTYGTPSNSEDLWISAPNTDHPFSGAIDEVRIYAAALTLTAEQIKRRYEQTKRDYVRAS